MSKTNSSPYGQTIKLKLQSLLPPMQNNTSAVNEPKQKQNTKLKLEKQSHQNSLLTSEVSLEKFLLGLSSTWEAPP